MSKKTQIGQRKSLLAGASVLAAAAAAMAGTPAMAQDAEEEEAIVVTGTRLARQDFEAISPVTTVGAEQLELTATLTTESLLNELPQIIPGNTRTSNNAGGFDYATVDLRGLGANRTLVLVNGERVPVSSTLGAVDINKALAPYSNFGSWVSVVAPGGNLSQDVNGDGKPDGVLSTATSDGSGALVNGYAVWQGTSMATPHVAGVATLMKAVAPSLTPQRFAELLVSGALTDDLGATGKDDQFGYGLINARKAVTAVGGGSGGASRVIDSSLLNFGINAGIMTSAP